VESESSVTPARQRHLKQMMTTTRAVLFVAIMNAITLAAQQPVTIDTAKLGPQVGTPVPPIAGLDQFGRPQTLASVAGPKGTMLVFFRSADW
jgi:hypothetical protein